MGVSERIDFRQHRGTLTTQVAQGEGSSRFGRFVSSGLGVLVGFGGLVGLGGLVVFGGLVGLGGLVGGTDVLVDVLVGGGVDVDVLVGGGTDVLVGGSAMLVNTGFGSLILNTGLPRAWSSRMTSCSKAGSRGLSRAA